jgi:hypothetical protein
MKHLSPFSSTTVKRSVPSSLLPGCDHFTLSPTFISFSFVDDVNDPVEE